MNKQIHLHSTMEHSSPGHPHREEWRLSKDGQRFNVSADRWQLSSRMAVSVGALRKICWSPVLTDAIVWTLAEYAVKGSPGTVAGLVQGIRRFLEFAAVNSRTDEISHALMLSYRDFCRRNDGHDYQISCRIRPFMRSWYLLGHPGVSKEIVETMEEWTLKNPERGVAVNRLDVDSGPLMPDEHMSLATHWLAAFERGSMSLVDYLMARLSSVTGRRPTQIMQLKLKDMDDTLFESSEPGQPSRRKLLLHIPRIKCSGSTWRTRFRAVPLSNDLWNLLMLQQNAVHDCLDAFLETCGLSLQPNDLAAIRGNMPFIPASRAMTKSAERIRTAVQKGQNEAIKELSLLVNSDAWHALPSRLSRAVNMETASVHNRDGGRLRVFPTRMRYTREFDLERAGCAQAVIAWNMDHSNTDSLAVYSKNGPERARSISNAMALKLAPFARIFQGRVVADEAEAEGGDDPAASRILFQNLTPGATCAAKRGCGMSAIPRPCYNGCPHFQPWVDGPHEEYLESLLEERERAFRLLSHIEDRAVIEAADSLIISVVQVIRLCDERRAELSTQGKADEAKRRRRRNAK